MIHPSDKILVFSKSSKRTEPVRWIEAPAMKLETHFVIRRRATKRPAIKVAYEHLRLAPSSKLAKELISVSLEEEMNTDTLKNLQQVDDMSMNERYDKNILDIFGKEGESEDDELHLIGKSKFLFTGSKPALGNLQLDSGICLVNDEVQ